MFTDIPFITGDFYVRSVRIRTKLYQPFASGGIKAVALGGKTLIPRDALESFLASLPVIGMQRLTDGDPLKNHIEIGGE